MQKSSREQLLKLFQENEQRMYRAAFSVLQNSADAEDAVQDAFIRAMRLPDKLLTLDTAEQGYYLCAIARNTALNSLKKRNRSRTVCIDDCIDIKADTDVESAMLSDFGVEQICRAISELSNDDYEILWMYCLKELSPSEISRLLGIKENAVRQRVFRAKKRLKAILEKEGEHDR